MKRVLYIGIYENGSTSKLRGEKIKKLLRDWEFCLINTQFPFSQCSRLFKSIGFRFKVGPVVEKVNRYILDNIEGEYDLIWVDKAIYITESTTKILKSKAKVMIHYTPDPAFLYHKSKHFCASINYYDCIVTTKSYEVEIYKEKMKKPSNLIYLTQGFDKSLHYPRSLWIEKSGVIFIGRSERERKNIIESMLQNGITVKLAGPGWKSFAQSHPSKYLIYMGEGLYGDKYVEAISSSHIAIGFLSKLIPDQHTTRTFEIPACKTVLLTEYTDEINSIFTSDEVLYYSNLDTIVTIVKRALSEPNRLETMAERAYNKVIEGNYDYESQIKYILLYNNVL